MIEVETSALSKFFTLVDDDTFFPTMSELLRTFSEYDPNTHIILGPSPSARIGLSSTKQLKRMVEEGSSSLRPLHDR